uniref:Insulin-like domain-containing protein n=1 Tax=Xenopus tropicalis TaxID=8364 RepID=A0A6I8RG05_XENTR
MLLSYLRDTHEASVHRLCGLHLVEALLLVCEGRGFYYRPQKVEKCCYRSCTYYDLEHYCNR